jgi:hypothetical protein
MPFNPNMGNPNQFQPMSPGQRQIEYARHLGTVLAEADYRRRRDSRAGKAQPLPSARSAVERPASAKKRTGIIIFLIAVTALTFGAVPQAHSTPVTRNATPGVISVGANIRTGPGTENSIAATAPAGTRIVIACRIRTSAGKWDELASPHRGLYVSATLVHSHRPARC